MRQRLTVKPGPSFQLQDKKCFAWCEKPLFSGVYHLIASLSELVSYGHLEDHLSHI